jgi:prepilin-type N-terminal cleavage/methylation domain-containing protein
MNKYYKEKNYQSGFTILEIMISIVIVSTIIGAIFLLQNFVLKLQAQTFNSYASVDSANRGVEIMVREIRNGRNGDSGAYVLEECSDQTLIFFSDTDNDGQTERIRYFLDNDELKKGVIEPAGFPISYTGEESIVTIAQDIRNNDLAIFYYYNGNWPQDTDNNPLSINERRLQTRLIKVHLLVNSNQEYLKTDYELSSFAHIRTLKDNL